MKLYRINITNFRGFTNIEVDDFKEVNLFVGKNNSGKTSLLEAIFLSLGVSNPNLVTNIDRFRGLLHVENDDFQYIFNKQDYNNQIEINTEFVKNNQFRRLVIKPIYEESSVKKSGDTSSFDSSSTIHKRLVNGIEFNFSVKTNKLSKDKFQKALLQYTSKGITYSPTKDYIEKLRGIFLFHATDHGDIYNRIDRVIIKKKLDSFIKSLRILDSRVVDVSLGANNMIYIDIGFDKLSPIQIMGDGIKKLLYILVTIADAEGGMVLIDEIEDGFHYSFLPKLWESIIETARIYDVQIFVTTHSLECAKSLNAVYQNKQTDKDDIRLFRIENNEGEFTSYKFDSEVLNLSLESNWEIR